MTVATRPRFGMRSADEQRRRRRRDRPTASHAGIPQRGHELAVDDAAQDRGRDLERRGIGDPEAVLEARLDAHAVQPLGHPLAAAVDQHDRPRGARPGDLRQDLLAGRRAWCRRA